MQVGFKVATTNRVPFFLLIYYSSNPGPFLVQVPFYHTQLITQLV
jgi:hypothetical protein